MGERSEAAGPNLVLVVGAPRSGTTWLQNMLGAHPSVASPRETDLFTRYLAPLTEAWRWQLRGGPDGWAARSYKGLPAVLTEAEFLDAARSFLDSILVKIAAMEPEATVVLEKSPSHSLSAETVAELAPRARVVHLVRDGRDVAASLVAASEGWGRWWAPSTLARAGRSWTKHVRGARRYADLGVPYLEVRYEALSGRDLGLLQAVHEFCGLDASEADCRARYDEYSFERMAGATEGELLVGGEFGPHAGTRSEAAGFFRKGQVAGWRDEWSVRDRLVFDAVAGDLLVELSYEAGPDWAADRGSTRRYRAEALAVSALAAAARRVARGADRLADRTPRR